MGVGCREFGGGGGTQAAPQGSGGRGVTGQGVKWYGMEGGEGDKIGAQGLGGCHRGKKTHVGQGERRTRWEGDAHGDDLPQGVRPGSSTAGNSLGITCHG